MKFAYQIGEVVTVKAIGIPGHVDGQMREFDGNTYRVIYWNGGNRHSAWLRGFELEKEPTHSKRFWQTYESILDRPQNMSQQRAVKLNPILTPGTPGTPDGASSCGTPLPEVPIQGAARHARATPPANASPGYAAASVAAMSSPPPKS